MDKPTSYSRLMSFHGYEGVMSVLCTPLQVKCYRIGTTSFGEFCQTPLHSKQCWVVLTQNWVKYGQTQMLG